MSKLAEQNYLALTGDAGKHHSLGKPFSDAGCGSNLASIGTIMALLPDPPARILDMGCGGAGLASFSPNEDTRLLGRTLAKT